MVKYMTGYSGGGEYLCVRVHAHRYIYPQSQIDQSFNSNGDTDFNIISSATFLILVYYVVSEFLTKVIGLDQKSFQAT